MSGLVLGFECEWFDPISQQLNILYLKYFADDNTIEILTSTRCMLARIYYEGVHFRDLFVGNSITVFNRLITIKKYANVGTERFMKQRETHIMVNLRSSAFAEIGSVLKLSEKYSLTIGKVRTSEAQDCDFLIQLIGYEGDAQAQKFVDAAMLEYKDKVSITLMKPAEMSQLMNGKFPLTVNEERPATLCLIKPHILRAKMLPDVLTSIIAQGYQIKGLCTVHLTNTVAEEIFDVYREIYPSFTAMINHMISAPCLAVYVYSDNADADFNLVEEFRAFCGPLSPELATTLRPGTLRATYGNSYIENAVHVTDLAEDGHMECKYFFETLAGL